MKSTFKFTTIVIISMMMLFNACTLAQKKNSDVRVLLVTGGHGFDKEPFYAFVNSLPGMVVTEVKHPDALAMFRAENRSSYDVVLFYDMPNVISEQEKKDFIDCLKEGKGMVVWHHAYCSYQDWSEYQTIIGGRYYEQAWTDSNGVEQPKSTYDHDVQFRVKVADTQHPVTKGIEDFDIVDETYGKGVVNPNVHILLTTDAPTSTPSIAWTNQYGKSKIVTVLLGHDNHAWTNPSFVKFLTQAINWVK